MEVNKQNSFLVSIRDFFWGSPLSRSIDWSGFAGLFFIWPSNVKLLE